MVAVAGLLTLPFGWVALGWHDIGLFAFTSVLVWIAQTLMIESLRLGEVGLVGPFKYTSLVWALALGAVVWGAPNPLIGADGSWIDLMGDGGAGCGAEGVCETEETKADEETSPSFSFGSFRRCAPLRPHAFKPSLAVRRRVLEEECGEVMRAFFRSRREANKKRAGGEDARAKAREPRVDG